MLLASIRACKLRVRIVTTHSDTRLSPAVQLPDTDRLPVRHLAGAFRRTTNSYKFYWLTAILRHVKESGDRLVALDDLLARMIAAVWYPVNYYRLSFGKLDRLGPLVAEAQSVSSLAEDACRPSIRHAIKQNESILAEVQSLDQYVPFRFLTPWFEDELRRMRDYKKNDRIEELAAASFDTGSPALYRFPSDPPRHIELHPRWFAYLTRHLRIIGDFCFWNLLDYLRGKNPNVPNIAGKLFRPKQQKLHGKPRDFWNLALDAHPELRCPYSGEPLVKGEFDVDHFLPWSFVSHDLLWNLTPASEAANRSKSDALPNLGAYFDNFATLQRAGFEAAFQQEKKSWLEDYALLFSDDLSAIDAMSHADFRGRLRERIAPLMQIAANTGFPAGWTYQKL